MTQFSLATKNCIPVRLHNPCRKPIHICAAIKGVSAKQICCSRVVVANQQHVLQVEQLCRDLAAHTASQMKDKDNGILLYELSKEEPNEFYLWERFQSSDMLNTHISSDRNQELMKKLTPYLEKPVGMSLYEYRDGKIGPSSVYTGPKGEGGLDDATGAARMRGGAGLRQTSSTVDLTNLHEEDEGSDVLHELQEAAKKQVDSVKKAFANLFGAKK